MGLRNSDIMAGATILAGAIAGLGLTNLSAHAHGERTRDEAIRRVETLAPRIEHVRHIHKHGPDHVRVRTIRGEGMSLERLEQAVEDLELDFEFDVDFDTETLLDGDISVDVQVDELSDERHKKKRKRRIVVKSPGREGPGGQ